MVFGLAWPASVPAQDSEELIIDASSCIDKQSALERYDCYERLVAEALERSGTIPSSSAPDQTPQRVERLRGFAEQPEAPDAERGDGAPDSGEFFGVIAGLEEIIPNRVLITLEDGQVWRQTQARRYPLRTGLEVRIYPGRWGSDFRLSATEVNGFIQVERIR